MAWKSSYLLQQYINDTKKGDVFSIEDIKAWIWERWPRYVPSNNTIGCCMKRFGNIERIDCGIYRVIQ